MTKLNDSIRLLAKQYGVDLLPGCSLEEAQAIFALEAIKRQDQIIAGLKALSSQQAGTLTLLQHIDMSVDSVDDRLNFRK